MQNRQKRKKDETLPAIGGVCSFFGMCSPNSYCNTECSRILALLQSVQNRWSGRTNCCSSSLPQFATQINEPGIHERQIPFWILRPAWPLNSLAACGKLHLVFKDHPNGCRQMAKQGTGRRLKSWQYFLKKKKRKHFVSNNTWKLCATYTDLRCTLFGEDVVDFETHNIMGNCWTGRRKRRTKFFQKAVVHEYLIMIWFRLQLCRSHKKQISRLLGANHIATSVDSCSLKIKYMR